MKKLPSHKLTCFVFPTLSISLITTRCFFPQPCPSYILRLSQLWYPSYFSNAPTSAQTDELVQKFPCSVFEAPRGLISFARNTFGHGLESVLPSPPLGYCLKGDKKNLADAFSIN